MKYLTPLSLVMVLAVPAAGAAEATAPATTAVAKAAATTTATAISTAAASTTREAAPAKESAAAPPPAGDVTMSGMSILGNDEAPKSLVIVPWKSSQLGDTPGISRLLDDSTQPVDRDVFMRELSYYEIKTDSK